MSLYDDARGETPDPAEHDQWCALCAGHGTPGHGPTDGTRIIANLRSEEHFCGRSGGAPSPAAFGAFLQDIVDEARRPAGTLAEAYDAVCRRHALCGVPLPSRVLPATLFRYVTFYWLRNIALGGDPAIVDEVSFDESLSDDWDVWKAALASVQFTRSSGESVFAAAPAEGSCPADGRPAAELLAVLGLKPDPPSRFELRYPSADVPEPRFPTVADAGWFAYFRPAAPGATIGCTWHRDNDVAGIPEIVHGTRSLACLTQRPRRIA